MSLPSSGSPAAAASADEQVRRVLARFLPAWRRPEQILPEHTLGFGGLEIDSVSTVQALLELERSTGVAFPARTLSDGPLTVGKLIDHLDRNRRPAQP
jgi:acyl carrier protein